MTKVNDNLAVAATNFCTSLGHLRQYYGTDPRNYFRFIREVREAKCKLRSTEGYPDLSAEIRGGIEGDEQNVFFGVYAASSSKETFGKQITRNPSTEQGLKDYFEIEDPCSLPPVCDSGSHFESLADRYRNGSISLASIAYLLCEPADCSRITTGKEDGQSETGCGRQPRQRRTLIGIAEVGKPTTRCEFRRSL